MYPKNTDRVYKNFAALPGGECRPVAELSDVERRAKPVLPCPTTQPTHRCGAQQKSL